MIRLFRRSPGAPPRLHLLSRPGCHLCEERLAAVAPLVREAGGTIDVVNVDTDPALAARFGEEIPVILDAEGNVLAKARDPLAKIRRRLLAG